MPGFRPRCELCNTTFYNDPACAECGAELRKCGNCLRQCTLDGMNGYFCGTCRARRTIPRGISHPQPQQASPSHQYHSQAPSTRPLPLGATAGSDGSSSSGTSTGSYPGPLGGFSSTPGWRCVHCQTVNSRLDAVKCFSCLGPRYCSVCNREEPRQQCVNCKNKFCLFCVVTHHSQQWCQQCALTRGIPVRFRGESQQASSPSASEPPRTTAQTQPQPQHPYVSQQGLGPLHPSHHPQKMQIPTQPLTAYGKQPQPVNPSFHQPPPPALYDREDDSWHLVSPPADSNGSSRQQSAHDHPAASPNQSTPPQHQNTPPQHQNTPPQQSPVSYGQSPHQQQPQYRSLQPQMQGGNSSPRHYLQAPGQQQQSPASPNTGTPGGEREMKYKVLPGRRGDTIPRHGNLSLADGAIVKITTGPSQLNRFNLCAGEIVVDPREDRFAEIIGTDGTALYWLVEGDQYVSRVPPDLLDFLSREDSKQCLKCGWAIPSYRYKNHDALCNVVPDATEPVEETVLEGEALQPGSYTDIQQLELLGQGAQGRVWKCTALGPRGAKSLIVVKEIQFASKEVGEFDKHFEKAQQLRGLNHTHLIRYLDIQAARVPIPTIKIIMPYYKESDLKDFISAQRQPVAGFPLCSLVLQVAQALKYLHERGIAHCDVKPDNILMFENCTRTLLMDLDTARNVTHGAKTMIGTMEYMAPEVMKGQGYSTQCDIWSLGVVLFTLLAMPEFPLLPLRGHGQVTLSCPDWTMAALYEAVAEAIRANSKGCYPESLITLVCKMLDHDPQRRPTAEHLCNRLEDIMTMILTSAPEC